MNKNLLITLLCASLLASCEFFDPEIDDDDFGPTVGIDCSYTAESVYSIGQDVTTDFSASDIIATTEVVASTCDEVQVGQSSQLSVDLVTRSGNTITLEKNGQTDSVAVTGTDLIYSNDASGCSSGIYLETKFKNGHLDTSGYNLVLVFDVGIDYDYCVYSVIRSEEEVKRKKSFLSLLPSHPELFY